MAIRSMTGFGQAEGDTPSGLFRVEIRGVNNRYLELQIRQPKFTSNLEQRIKKEFSSIISRGSISIIITCDRESEGLELSYDKNAVDNYIRIFREVKKDYSLPDEVSLSHLLQFSDFIKAEIPSIDEETVWSQIKPILQKAIESFQKSRENEGVALVKEFKKMLREISKSLKAIEKRAPLRIKEYGKALTERIEKLIANPPDPLRIATEIAICADRLDISEECTRLKAHIEKFEADFSLDEPVGKRLGFLLQEMNREANTIGSKANDTEISHLSVHLKELIEKIREQLQNIE